ncbi:unnamed protein product [Penicillium camemberti]|uniref:Str. FM013 n=1 Tax=Penicillium camemberti (strain FM 013) TaxID=1429867 RepID=A0A0G4PIJ4_PENC3|nr:unnamed protein product [Penicillium camemberti]
MGFLDMPTQATFLYDENFSDCLRYGSEYVLRAKLIELFLAEHALRELTQREEWLHQKVMALQKAIAITPARKTDMTELKTANKQLKKTHAQFPRREYALYLAECKFHLKTKDTYDSLRRDDK